METVELKNFLVPLDIFVEEFDYIYSIQVRITVKDRDDPEKNLLLTFSQGFQKEDYSKSEAVRVMVKYAMTHEVDECLLVNGERVFDPHVLEV